MAKPEGFLHELLKMDVFYEFEDKAERMCMWRAASEGVGKVRFGRWMAFWEDATPDEVVGMVVGFVSRFEEGNKLKHHHSSFLDSVASALS